MSYVCPDSTYARGHGRPAGEEAGCHPVFTVCSPTSAAPQGDPKHFTPQIETDQLHDTGQFATPQDMESLVLTALGSLCQEARDLCSTGRGRCGRGRGPSTPSWALAPNELARAPELRDMVLEGPAVSHSPGPEASACMATSRQDQRPHGSSRARGWPSASQEPQALCTVSLS